MQLNLDIALIVLIFYSLFYICNAKKDRYNVRYLVISNICILTSLRDTQVRFIKPHFIFLVINRSKAMHCAFNTYKDLKSPLFHSVPKKDLFSTLFAVSFHNLTEQ